MPGACIWNLVSWVVAVDKKHRTAHYYFWCISSYGSYPVASHLGFLRYRRHLRVEGCGCGCFSVRVPTKDAFDYCLVFLWNVAAFRAGAHHCGMVAKDVND